MLPAFCYACACRSITQQAGTGHSLPERSPERGAEEPNKT